MKILNETEINDWLFVRQVMNHDVVSIKGTIKGLYYDGGEPIINPVNIAWKDIVTNEVISIKYEV